MRLFVAVDLSDRARERVMRLAQGLRRRLESSAPRARITWVEPENLHLTLKFLGEVDETRVPPLREVLALPLSGPVFTAVLSGTGVFPPGGAPRVIWLGASEGAIALEALHAQVEGRLGPLGFGPEDRAFTAHLTLGRVREAGGAVGPGIRRIVQEAVVEPIHWIVSGVTLYQSQLSPHGPRYVPIAVNSLTSSS